MKTLKLSAFLLVTTLALPVSAQDGDEAFDDLPDMSAEEAAKPAPKSTPSAAPAPKVKPTVQAPSPKSAPTAEPPRAKAQASTIPDEDEPVLADDAEPTDQIKSADTAPEVEEIPADEPPPALSASEPAPAPTLDVPAALESKLVDDSEPGSALDPSEKFYRVPLKPQMSDANWRKWAGPSLDKTYRIHRGDTLWGVSERLFGNPFLWPKVWQLNAVVSNPNIIPTGLETQFMPGNPNSAPELAFRSQDGYTTDELPLLLTQQKLSMMDRIDQALRAQNTLSNPPFKFFVASSKPDVITKVRALKKHERLMLSEGDHFSADCEDGSYAVVRFLPLTGNVTSGYRIQWLGNATVKQDIGQVTHSYSEIQPGDLLIRRNFALSPLALHEERIGNGSADFMALEEGAEHFSAELRLVGARFSSAESGPRPGALVEVTRGQDKVAKLLLVNRDRRYGTFWVVENHKEIDIPTDKLGDN